MSRLTVRPTTGASGMCTTCMNRREVTSKNQGTVVLRCGAFPHMNLQKAGEVDSCTAYESVHDHYLFGRDAWLLYKNNQGEWKFVDPNDPNGGDKPSQTQVSNA